jgi:two-component system, chemotaxis family, CheB/CheR fusion protein
MHPGHQGSKVNRPRSKRWKRRRTGRLVSLSRKTASNGAPLVQAPPPRPEYIIGLGASAGGLDALQVFFDKMPPDTGLAFVVIQHLSPDFRSMMDELLARHTSMRIHRVEDGMLLEQDSVYLIPPKKEMIVSDGRLLLTDKDPSQAMSLPIDLFFRSLAQDAGNRAVGIVLSGTGSDGSRGIRGIHEAGGLVMVQSEESALFDGMPRSAIETGVADLVLPPQAMPEALLKLLGHPEGEGRGQAEEGLAPPQHEGQFGEILALLMERYGIDFVFYKPTTVGRRIERRMSITRSATLNDYVNLLRNDSHELNLLYKDLLIGVTQFFRDTKAFARLQQDIVPRLVKQSESGETLRIWCPGCATGEEVYSLAILFKECAEMLNAPLNLKIFATDVHPDSLNRATAGLYTEESLKKVSVQRVKRFFNKEGELFRIVPELRRMVVFAQHNLIKDPPFTKVDLISCRNLLIYLQPIIQNKILSLFHFALKIGGVLFLGPSESLGELHGEFDSLDKHWRIFSKRRDVRLTIQSRFPGALGMGEKAITGFTPKTQPHAMPDTRVSRAYEALLQKFVPPSMLINEHNELVHMFGDAGAYLKHTAGRFNLDILNMVEGDLRVALASALQRVAKDKVPVVYRGIHLDKNRGGPQITLSVEPLLDKTQNSCHSLVSIEPLDEKAPPQQPHPDAEVFTVSEQSRSRIHDLEREILFMRENLQATVEELETSNEELQASNEELLASNEELQSTNEELHSVNEELYTVNAEYEKKIKELLLLSNDMDNLMRSTSIGVVFVDRNLHIRKFTPAVTEIFNLMPQDEGRPIAHISHTLDNKKLLSEISATLKTGKPQDKEVRGANGKHFVQRILPYLDENNAIQGVVLNYFDITEVIKTREELERAKDAAETSNKAKSLFLTKVSHQIRTPLNAVLGMLEMALDTELDQRQRDYLDTAREASGHMLRVIDDILDFSRIESGTLNILSIPFDLHDTLRSAVDTLAPEAKELQLELGLHIKPTVPRFVFGDPARLAQIMLNLVSNAIKFTRSGSIKCEVGPDTRAKASRPVVRLLFSVADTGIGIPENKQRHVFEGLYQAASPTRPEQRGAGLGLSICKQFVTLMGGDIRVTSTLDMGSVFSFSLPFRTAAEEDLHPRRSVGHGPSHAKKSLRLLVVDDNFVNRKVMVISLEQRGHTVLQAVNGHECLDILARNYVDLVIMDLEMPLMDGCETTRRIRLGESGVGASTVPILAVTAHALDTHRHDALAAGMNDCLIKPVDLDALHTRIVHLTGSESDEGNAEVEDNREGQPAPSEVSSPPDARN